MKKHSTYDEDDDEIITDEMWASARPIEEIIPGIGAAMRTARRGRGKQKTPTKELISIRVDRDAIAAYRATGKGWQSRLSQTIAEHAPRRRRSATAARSADALRTPAPVRSRKG